MKNSSQQLASIELDIFDYSCIADKAARLAAVDAAANVRHSLSNQAEVIMEVGTLLIDAKENLLPHGFFNDWLRFELAMSPRTAQQYMSVARNFGAKPATVAHLKPTTLYELSSAKNEQARLVVVEQLQAGEPLDDARVLEIARAMRPENKLEAATEKSADQEPEDMEANGRRADALEHSPDAQHNTGYPELVTFLAPRCFGEFEYLITLVEQAGCDDLAAYMKWHYDALMKDVTRLLPASVGEEEEPELFNMLHADSITRVTERRSPRSPTNGGLRS